MKQLLEDIKTGEWKQVYLLYGAEGYLRRQYRDKLREALASPDDTMNVHYFEGKDTQPGEVIDLAETMPFFAERRVIVVENSGFFKKSGEQLADYIRRIAPTSYLIFTEAEVDKRGKLFKAVKDKGRCVEFPVQDENTLKKWILVQLKKENKKISEPVLNHFLQMTGTEMENIRRELEKLFCYTLERDGITEADVNAVCVRQISNQIFEMVGAIAERRQKQALRLYYDLLALKEPPMRILFLIGRQFNLLLQVKELKKKGYDNRSIAEKTGLHSFVAGKYVNQAAGFGTAELRQALEACVEADERVKTGRMNDVMSVELLIIRYSSKERQTEKG